MTVPGGRRPAVPSPSVFSARPLLYLVTDRRLATPGRLVDLVAAALRGGVGAVQLREKDLDGGPLRQLAAEILAVCRFAGALFLVNGRIDVAVAVGADGVHLPSDSFRVGEARSLLGPGKIIGISTHSAGEVARAARDGADYAIFGPVFATPSKSGFGEPQGLERLRLATSAAHIPVLAIGGITAERAPLVLAAGAAGVAVISALLAAEDVESAARAFS